MSRLVNTMKYICSLVKAFFTVPLQTAHGEKLSSFWVLRPHQHSPECSQPSRQQDTWPFFLVCLFPHSIQRNFPISLHGGSRPSSWNKGEKEWQEWEDMLSTRKTASPSLHLKTGHRMVSFLLCRCIPLLEVKSLLDYLNAHGLDSLAQW